MSTARLVAGAPADLALKAEIEHRTELYRRHRDKLTELHERALLSGWSEAQIVAVSGEYLR